MKRQISMELLMDYIEGLLDPETEAKLSKQIAESDELFSMVQGIKIFYKERGEDRQALEDYLATLSANYAEWMSSSLGEAKVKSMHSDDGKRSRSFSAYQIAAVIALVLIAGVVLFKTMNASSEADELVAKELNESYRSPVMFRSDETSSEQQWSEAIAAYKAEDFLNAADIFGRIVQDNPDNLYASFYAGISFLYAGEFSLATEYLKPVSESSNRMKEQATWYLSLAWYKVGDIELTIGMLNTIIAENEFKKEEAESLLKEINNR